MRRSTVFFILALLPAGVFGQVQSGGKDSAIARLKQARELAMAGRFAEAIPLYEEVLPAAEAELGPDSPALGVLDDAVNRGLG